MRKLKQKITYIKESSLPITITLHLTLAIITALNALKIEYYKTIHRVTIKTSFTIQYDLTSTLIILIIIIGLYLSWRRQYKIILTATIISITTYLLKSLRASAIITSIAISILTAIKFKKIRECIYWTLITATIIEVLSLTHWLILKPTNEATLLEDIAKFEHDISSLTALMSLAIVILILYTWILKPIAKQYVKSIKQIITILQGKGGEIKSKPLKINSKAILITSILISILTAIYPYLPTINPKNILVGVDARYYIQYASQLEKDIANAFKGYGRGSRPLILLIIYGLSKAANLSIKTVVRYLPILIHPLLAIGIYVMVNETTRDEEWAALSSLLTTTGIITTSNMYAYILANTLAIALLYISTGHLIKAIKTWNLKSLTIAIATAIMTMLIHPWTFTQYYAAILLTAIIIPIEAILTRRSRKMILIAQAILITYLLFTGILVLIKIQVIGGVESKELLKLIDSLIKGHPGLNHLMNFWYESFTALLIYYGGALSNITLLVLALIGSYQLNHKEELDKFIITLTAVSSIAYLIVYDHSKVRLILNIPIGALAAKGLLEIMRNEKIEGKTKIATLIFTITTTLTYTLRSLANLI